MNFIGISFPLTMSPKSCKNASLSGFYLLKLVLKLFRTFCSDGLPKRRSVLTKQELATPKYHHLVSGKKFGGK